MRIPSPEHQHQGVKSTALTLGVGFRPHCGVLCQTLAGKPHESSKMRYCRTLMFCEGLHVSRFTGTQLSSQRAAVYQSQVQVCVVSGIITVLLAPPESSPQVIRITGTGLESQ